MLSVLEFKWLLNLTCLGTLWPLATWLFESLAIFVWNTDYAKQLKIQPIKKSELKSIAESSIEEEITAFKEQEASSYGSNFWRKEKNQNLYPILLCIFKYLYTISPSSSQVERIFSRAGLVCTDLRSRLAERTIEGIIMANTENDLDICSYEWI